MQPKEKLNNFILIWLAINIISLVAIAVIQNYYEFLLAAWILSNIIFNIFFQSFQRKSIKNLREHLFQYHPAFYGKYASSNEWNPSVPKFTTILYFIFSKHLKEDSVIQDKKIVCRNMYLFLLFDALFAYTTFIVIAIKMLPK